MSNAIHLADARTFSEGTGRFRPKARLLRTIGAELISSEIVAIIELVRNSYDADASRVELRFERPESRADATVELWDNGHGMSRDTLLGPWLEPATDFKHKESDGLGGSRSPRGRRRLGSKGVGRFAAQRLGAHLSLHSRVAGAAVELRAIFDWTRLDHADRYLDELEIPWSEIQPERIPDSGTSLLVSGLRDEWTHERFEKLRVGLSRLVSPTLSGDEFGIYLVVNGVSERVEPAIDQASSMYSMTGEVTDGGHCHITYRDMSGTEEVWERQVLWPSASETCGSFRFRINAWDLDREPLQRFFETTGTKMGLRDFRRLIREHSGISLYRDGFRILPYGEPDNDWLRLDRRRVNNPTLRFSNNQILGWVHLSADGNPGLKDQTNREGLVVNDAYQHLQRVMLELLGYLETRRFTARRSMNLASSSRARSLPAIEDGQDRLEQLLGRFSEGAGSDSARAEIQSLFSERQQALSETVQQYAGLATIGQMSNLVFSQLKRPLKQAMTQANLALSDLGDDQLSFDDIEDLRESLDTIVGGLKLMEQRIKQLDPLAAPRRGLEFETIEPRVALLPVVQAFQEEFDAAGVSLTFDASDVSKIHTVPSVVQQVLSILLDNAVHWAARSEERPWVAVRLTTSGFEVSNNGPAIDDSDCEAIFEPHFSRREGARGMGLTLARDLLSAIGGRLVATPQASGAMFRTRVSA